MHICVSKLAIISSDNGLSPGRRQPLSEPMLEYCQLDPWEQTSMKSKFEYIENAFENVIKFAAIFSSSVY